MKHFYKNFSHWFISIGCKVVCLKMFHSHHTFKVNRYTKSFRTSSFPLLPLSLPILKLLSSLQMECPSVHPSTTVCTHRFPSSSRIAHSVICACWFSTESRGKWWLGLPGLTIMAGVYILHLLHQWIYHGDFVCLLLSKRKKAFAWGRKTTRYSLQKWSTFSQFNLIYNSS